MPPRNPELPEGTDHIINGAMETNGGETGSFGGGTGSGFVGSAGGDDTGGLSARGTGQALKSQLKDSASSVQQQAGEKIRAYAETGKSRATTALDDLTQVVNDAATTIDERLGSEYGEYARRAADAVSGFADTLRRKEVDELFDDGRNLVRKSPGVAIGIAAVVGFTLVRLLKSGTGDQSGQTRTIEFEPDAAIGGGTAAGTGSATGLGNNVGVGTSPKTRV